MDHNIKQERIVHGPLEIHTGRVDVLVDGRQAQLTLTEFRLLLLLMNTRPGWVLTREQIVEELHGDRQQVTPRAVDVQIVGLRKKLGEAGNLIETVRGFGYRMKVLDASEEKRHETL